VGKQQSVVLGVSVSMMLVALAVGIMGSERSVAARDPNCTLNGKEYSPGACVADDLCDLETAVCEYGDWYCSSCDPSQSLVRKRGMGHPSE
jgi:hypothetical protein